MRALTHTACVFLVLSCAPGATNESGGGTGEGVTLSVDRAQYRPGDALVVTLRNQQPHSVGYNLCSTLLERRAGAAWQEAQPRLTEVCTMELRTLTSGESATYQHRIPPGTAAGEYRVRTSVESPLGGGPLSVQSEPFRVGAG